MKEEQANRLMEVIKAKNLTPTEFGKALGFKSGAPISHIKNGRVEIGNSMILRIQNYFPEINTNWILTGDGDMMIHNDTNVLNELHDAVTHYMPSTLEKKWQEKYEAAAIKYMDLLDRYEDLVEENEMLKRQLKGYKAG